MSKGQGLADRPSNADLRVGVIGSGAIARYLVHAIAEDRVPGIALAGIAGRTSHRVELRDLARQSGCAYTTDPLRLPRIGAQLVVEAASREAVLAYAVPLLRRRVDLLIMSVGALADETVLTTILDTARSYGRRVHIPAGAVGGLDLIQAARLGLLDRVALTTIKPPAAFSSPARAADQATAAAPGRVTLFAGPAREAVRRYPRNLNVAAALSLAGVGFDDTHVTLVMEPSADANMHRIEVQGEFGTATIVVSNVPDQTNPRTSRLAAMNALSVLDRLVNVLQIG